MELLTLLKQFHSRGRCARDSPGEVVERSHAETGHHSTLTLFREQLLPHALLVSQRLLHLWDDKRKLLNKMKVKYAFHPFKRGLFTMKNSLVLDCMKLFPL